MLAYNRSGFKLSVSTLRATQAIVRRDHLRHNYRQVRTFLHPDIQICSVVKANGYGHGIVEVAKTLEQEGTNALAVACLNELWTLREAGIKVPIHLLSPCLPEEIAHAVQCNAVPFVCTAAEVDLWQQAAAKAERVIDVHMAVDTGMSRIGCPPACVKDLAKKIGSCRNLRLAGLATHFARADEADPAHTEGQLSLFCYATQQLANRVQTIHVANSAGLLCYPQGHYNMVRPGLVLYGYSPVKEGQHKLQLELKPVLQLISRVLFLKKVPTGTAVSYGGTYVTPKETYIATVPLGYADGYARALSNKAQVVIGGHKYPLVGNICMDQLMVDVGNPTPVQLYDQVSFFGDEAGLITAVDVAEQMGSLSYEVLTSLGSRIPRIYKD